jgi:hypothetical protein
VYDFKKTNIHTLINIVKISKLSHIDSLLKIEQINIAKPTKISSVFNVVKEQKFPYF